jgi:transcriptional regulator
MYEPPHFVVDDRDALHALVRAHPLGLLVIAREGRASADAVPFLFDAATGPHGLLRAHVARANPLWRDADGREALVVFQGPGHYMSPGWYPSKAEHGKVVPTWNYAIVQARGTIRVRDSKDWIRGQVGELTQTHEREFERSWAVEDAPHAFIEAQMSAIVGIEIEVSALKGKFKLSQNRSDVDRRGVEAALAERGDQGEALELMNRLKEPGA